MPVGFPGLSRGAGNTPLLHVLAFSRETEAKRIYLYIYINNLYMLYSHNYTFVYKQFIYTYVYILIHAHTLCLKSRNIYRYEDNTYVHYIHICI